MAGRQLSLTWLLALGLTGCAGLTKTGSTRRDDPLLGGPSGPPPNASPLSLNPAIDAPSGMLGQPMVQSQPLTHPTAASPAVLATGAYPPLTGGQDLRIGTPPANSGGNRILPKSQTPPGVVAVVTADPDYGKPATAVPGVTPIDNVGARPINNPNALPTAGGGLEAALTQLAMFNPKWHRLESTSPGAWRFSCSVADRAEPNKNRTFEAEGASAASAVQQVLDRIRQVP